MKVCVVTGYVPLPVLHVSQEQFKALGQQLKDACSSCEVISFDNWPLENCWMYRTFHQYDIEPGRPAPADRFAKPEHRVWSDYVQHQKMEWVRQAWVRQAQGMGPNFDVYVWIDYGVLKQPDMTPETITRFIEKLKAASKLDKILLPGLRDKEDHDHLLSWERFSGAVVIVPKQWIEDLSLAMKLYATAHVFVTKKSWQECDTYVHLERAGILPIRQYMSWWGASQFDNLPELP